MKQNFFVSHINREVIILDRNGLGEYRNSRKKQMKLGFVYDGMNGHQQQSLSGERGRRKRKKVLRNGEQISMQDKQKRL